MKLPLLYPILDAGLLARRGIPLEIFARELLGAGVRWLQYRDKGGADAKVLEQARRLRAIFPPGEAALLLNDRVHLCAAAAFDGAHIGQGDMPAEAARALLGPGRILGVSTHTTAQVQAAEATSADYLAIGPVFATSSKNNPDPEVGLAGVAEARRLSGKPLVAIGGITRANARAVIADGANSVAVLSALLPPVDRATGGPTVGEAVRDFLANLR